MIKLENTEIVGWEAAIRGMRNPMNSWDKSDTVLSINCRTCGVPKSDDSYETKRATCEMCRTHEGYIGPNDHSLMMKLAKAGTDHRKFMRMITVYVDVTAPLYW